MWCAYKFKSPLYFLQPFFRDYNVYTLASRVYPESQCGFRAGRSTVDIIVSLRQLQVKCQGQRMPLYITFIDLTKAFNLVSRMGLFRLLQKIGCLPHLLAVVTSFHENMHSIKSVSMVQHLRPSQSAA